MQLLLIFGANGKTLDNDGEAENAWLLKQESQLQIEQWSCINHVIQSVPVDVEIKILRINISTARWVDEKVGNIYIYFSSSGPPIG